MNVKSLFPRLAASRSIIFYALASAIPAGSNFLATPFLVRFLGTSGFADWATLEPLLAIGSAVIALGAQFGVLNAVAKDGSQAPAAMAAFLVISVFTIPLMLLADTFILRTLFGIGVIVSMVAAQWLEGWAIVVATVSRGLRRPFTLLVTEGGRAASSLAMIIAIGITGKCLVTVESLLAIRASVALVAFILFSAFVICPKALNTSASIKYLHYGFPIFLAQIVMLCATNLDRFSIKHFGFGDAAMTDYVVHVRVAGMLNLLLIAPLSLWYPVEAMRRDRHTDGAFFEGVEVIVASGFVMVLSLMLLMLPFLWPILFHNLKLDPILLTLSVGFVLFQGMAVVWNVGALQPGKTAWNILPAVVFLCANTVASLYLAPIFGLIGVALAKLIGVACYAFGFFFISSRLGSGRKRAIYPLGLTIAVAGTISLAVGQSEGSSQGEIIGSFFAFTGILVFLIQNRGVLRAVTAT